MTERRLRAVIIGPANPGFLKVMLGQNDARFVADVPAERIPPGLRMPNSSFVAVVVGRDLVRVEVFGHARMEIEDRIRAVLNAEWDPIGVAHAVDDEYDGYIAPILSLLEQNAGVEMLAEQLLSIEVQRMELRGSPRGKLLRVADALRTLRLPWSGNTRRDRLGIRRLVQNGNSILSDLESG